MSFGSMKEINMEMISPLRDLLKHPEFAEGRQWERLQIKANQIVFHQDEPSHSVYLILSGTVRIIGRLDIDEHRHVQPGMCDLSAGEVFGELPLIDNKPRSASVVAVTDGELAIIDSATLMSFLDSHPDIGYRVFKELNYLLVERLRKANKKIFSLFAWGLKNCGITEHL